MKERGVEMSINISEKTNAILFLSRLSFEMDMIPANILRSI